MKLNGKIVAVLLALMCLTACGAGTGTDVGTQISQSEQSSASASVSSEESSVNSHSSESGASESSVSLQSSQASPSSASSRPSSSPPSRSEAPSASSVSAGQSESRLVMQVEQSVLSDTAPRILTITDRDQQEKIFGWIDRVYHYGVERVDPSMGSRTYTVIVTQNGESVRYVFTVRTDDVGRHYMHKMAGNEDIWGLADSESYDYLESLFS